MQTEERALAWLTWFNAGGFERVEEHYAPAVTVQRLGIRERLAGRDAVLAFLRQEREALPGLRLDLVSVTVEGDAAALEAEVGGFDPALQRFDSPYLRLGPVMIFLTFTEGGIVHDHTYVAAAPQRTTPVGLDDVRYPSSAQPLPHLLQRWESLYRTDPEAMMLECYTEDGTVRAMRPGTRPVERPRQIEGERRSFRAFPGHRIEMKRWLVTPSAIAVEFTWEGEHHRDPERTLRTISACHLRLHDGLIVEDHSYIPTGPA